MTVPITLNTLGSLTNESTALTVINGNSAAITTAFDSALNTAGDQMEGNLDLNSFQIINLPAPATNDSPLRLTDLNSFIGGGTITGIPVGGTTGQALSKTSNVNYAVGWENAVSSVGLALPADFTVTGSPVVNTGTLTGAWATTPTGTGAVVRATSPTLVTPVLGTPTSATLTNATGLPVSTGISGLGTGVSTFLATPTSANLAAAITDETGTGSNVFATTPTLVTPVLGVATATSINKMAITAPATSSTLAVANSKTFTANNTLTLAGTDSTTLTFQGTDTYVGRATTDTLTNKTIDTAGPNTLKIAGNTITQGQIIGTNTSDNAATGFIGEYIESDIVSGSAVNLTTNVAANVTSISLTAGDWEVNADVVFAPAGSTVPTAMVIGVNTTSATLPTSPNKGASFALSLPFTTGQAQIFPSGTRRYSFSTTTTVFLIAFSTFTVSTMQAYGVIRARRVR